MGEPHPADDGPQFFPIRATAARSLRPGDHILVHEAGFPDTSRRGPHSGYKGRITDIREDEATCTITVNGELIGENGLFEKQAHPWDMFDRLVQPCPRSPESRVNWIESADRNASPTGLGSTSRSSTSKSNTIAPERPQCKAMP